MKIQDFAHLLWQGYAKSGDTLIDATAGNGYDTLFLAELLQGEGKLYALDIQKEAIEKTKKLLASLPEVWLKPVELIVGSHSELPLCQPTLIVYNLGYLPGSTKEVTTKVESSLASLQQATAIVAVGGAISVTLYVGHEEGRRESDALLAWSSQLPSDKWEVSHHRFLNRKLAPSLLFFVRRS